jgi:hypothetical protein
MYLGYGASRYQKRGGGVDVLGNPRKRIVIMKHETTRAITVEKLTIV